MSMLKKLANSIRKDNKMSSDDLMTTIIMSVEEYADEDSRKDVYMSVYTRAYGNNLTKEVAEEWVKTLKVTDGSSRDNGMKWSVDQTTEVGNSIGIDWAKISKVDWFVAMNMEYSKHFNTAKSFGNETDPTWFAMVARDEWCGSDHNMFQYYIDTVI